MARKSAAAATNASAPLPGANSGVSSFGNSWFIWSSMNSGIHLPRTNRPISSGPAINILEQMSVHATVVRGVESALRKGLLGPNGGHLKLKGLELDGIANFDLVL